MFKKAIIYLLLAQMVSVTVCKCSIFNEVLKVAELIEHFQQHSKHDSSMTLLEFFDMHYFQETVHDADYADDMKLPFKSEHKLLQQIQLTAVFPVFNIHFPSFISLVNWLPLPEVSAKAITVIDVIWQPPKF